MVAASAEAPPAVDADAESSPPKPAISTAAERAAQRAVEAERIRKQNAEMKERIVKQRAAAASRKAPEKPPSQNVPGEATEASPQQLRAAKKAEQEEKIRRENAAMKSRIAEARQKTGPPRRAPPSLDSSDASMAPMRPAPGSPARLLTPLQPLAHGETIANLLSDLGS